MAVPAKPIAGAPIESAWGSIVHDTTVALDIQSGSAITPSTAAGVDNSSIAVTFPRPFASIPIVVACNNTAGAFIAVATGITTTGFTLTNHNRAAGTGSLGARTNSWVAIGPRT